MESIPNMDVWGRLIPAITYRTDPASGAALILQSVMLGAHTILPLLQSEISLIG
jgi:hypothetical protein